MGSTLSVVMEDRVAWVTFTRPSAANSIDLELATEFRDLVSRLDADDGCSVLVLQGDERFFSAGGDVATIFGQADAPEYLRELVDTLHAGIDRLSASRLVVVSVVEGNAAGAGFALVLNSDIVLSSPGARYLSAYTGVGLTPDTGLSYLLPRVVGERRAAELVLLGRVLDAQTAREWGIVTEVVNGSLADRAREVVAILTAAAQPALGEAKRLLISGRTRGLADQLVDERDTIVRMIVTPDAQERLRVFVARSESRGSDRK